MSWNYGLTVLRLTEPLSTIVSTINNGKIPNTESPDNLIVKYHALPTVLPGTAPKSATYSGGGHTTNVFELPQGSYRLHVFETEQVEVGLAHMTIKHLALRTKALPRTSHQATCYYKVLDNADLAYLGISDALADGRFQSEEIRAVIDEQLSSLEKPWCKLETAGVDIDVDAVTVRLRKKGKQGDGYIKVEIDMDPSCSLITEELVDLRVNKIKWHGLGIAELGITAATLHTGPVTLAAGALSAVGEKITKEDLGEVLKATIESRFAGLLNGTSGLQILTNMGFQAPTMSLYELDERTSTKDVRFKVALGLYRF